MFHRRKSPSLSYCRSEAQRLYLSQHLPPSLIPALYIELGNSLIQNTVAGPIRTSTPQIGLLSVCVNWQPENNKENKGEITVSQMTIYFVVGYRIVVIGKVNWCVSPLVERHLGNRCPGSAVYWLNRGVNVVSNVDASPYSELYVD